MIRGLLGARAATDGYWHSKSFDGCSGLCFIGGICRDVVLGLPRSPFYSKVVGLGWLRSQFFRVRRAFCFGRSPMKSSP